MQGVFLSDRKAQATKEDVFGPNVASYVTKLLELFGLPFIFPGLFAFWALIAIFWYRLL